MFARPALTRWPAENWFFLVVPLLLAISFGFARSEDWAAMGRMFEAALLFDWCVTVPALYALCYRKSMPVRRLIVRMAALSCLGVWIAAQLVPADSQAILPHLGWARTLGLIVLALIELRLVIAAIRLAFSGNATAADLSTATGGPPLIAKLMLIEAGFWRAVWKLIRRH